MFFEHRVCVFKIDFPPEIESLNNLDKVNSNYRP